MAVTRANIRRSTAARTAARKRRAMHLGRIERTAGVRNAQVRFRQRLWVVQDWLKAEAAHLSPEDQERLLAELVAVAERFNERGRQ